MSVIKLKEVIISFLIDNDYILSNYDEADELNKEIDELRDEENELKDMIKNMSDGIEKTSIKEEINSIDAEISFLNGDLSELISKPKYVTQEDILGLNEEILDIIKDNAEDIIYEFFYDALNLSETGNIFLEVERIDDSNDFDISIAITPDQDDGSSYYKRIYAQLSPIELMEITEALMSKNHNRAQGIINKIEVNDVELLEADEDTRLFYYTLDFDLEDEEDLTRINNDLSKILEKYNHSINLSDDELFLL